MLTEPITLGEIVRQLGIAGLCLVLWWLERKERIKLSDRLDDCLEKRADDKSVEDNLQP